MGIILKAAGEGVFLTAEEIYARVSYKDECTFGAIRVSLRFLADKKMLERQKTAGGAAKMVPTQLAYDWFRPQV